MEMNNQKGFANIILAVVVIIILMGAVGYFAFVKKFEPVVQQPIPTSTQTETPISLTPTPTPQNQTSSKTQSPVSILKDSKSVCRYVQQYTGPLLFDLYPIDKCNNYICNAQDAGEYWDVSYRCPGPSNFPMGQGYSLEVNKASGSIKITGATN